MTEREKDAEFIAGVAGPLRAPESVDASFEQRLMSAVYAEVRARGRRRRTLSLSPLAALAVAAGIVGIFAAGGATALLTHRSVADTVHVVRFIFVDSVAHSVALVGDFNGWAKSSTQLAPTGNRGVWSVSIPLTAGRHEYAFIVDGKRWVADPFATTRHDDFGTESSIVTLGGTQS